VAATVLYDLFFCTAHFVLHKVPSLYQHLHKSHHSHPQGMLADVTGQLALAENLADILLANLALKLVGAHPMTRFLYVPILLLLLVDNHAGFDFPWNYHRVVPFGVCGGGPAHFDHHQKSAVHYQPFFTYLTPLLYNLCAAMFGSRPVTATFVSRPPPPPLLPPSCPR
jgi:cholesterol 25-hydroxylase